MAESSRPVSPAALRVVRTALVGSVTTIAVIAVVLHRPDAEVAPVLPAVGTALATAAVLLMFVLRGRAAAAPPAGAGVYVILAWAAGEGAAMFGWILHLLGVPLVWALPGTLAFVAGLAGVPVPEEPPPG